MSDTPQHRITTRPATPEELRIVRAEAGPEWVSWGCIALLGLLPGLGFAFVGFMLGRWLGGALGPTRNLALLFSWIGVVVGAAAGLTLVFKFARSFARLEARRRARGARDLRQRHVEHIDVEGADVVELEPAREVDPALCFQIGPETLLLLQGQWLRETSTYEAPELEDDPLDDRVNGLPDPHGFPSAAFEVVRLPESGRVLRIGVKGAYLRPRQVRGELLTAERFDRDSEILRGDLVHLKDVLRGRNG